MSAALLAGAPAGLCEMTWLTPHGCAHCRPDVQERLAADPVLAAWLMGDDPVRDGGEESGL